MKPWSSLPCSQESATIPCPEPDASNPYLQPYFSKIHSNIIFLSTARSSDFSLSFRFSNKNYVCILHLSPACYISKTSHNLDLIIVKLKMTDYWVIYWSYINCIAYIASNGGTAETGGQWGMRCEESVEYFKFLSKYLPRRTPHPQWQPFCGYRVTPGRSDCESDDTLETCNPLCTRPAAVTQIHTLHLSSSLRSVLFPYLFTVASILSFFTFYSAYVPPPPNLIFHLTLPLFTLFSFLQLSISLFRYFSPHISVTLFTILSPHFSLFSYLPLSVSPFTFHTASSTLVSFLSILYFLIFPSTCLLFNIASSTLLRSVSIYLSLSLTSSVSSPILLHSLTL